MSHTTSAVVAAAFVSTAKMGADTQADSWADFLSILQVFTGRSSTPALNVLSSWVFLVPVLAVSIVVAHSGWPCWQLGLLIVPMAIALIGGPMSICLHRYFGHSAFRTTRPFQFVLGLVSCLAWQRGPLWWAGKHRRHHKHCDGPGDPHSAVQTNFAYAWLGWTMSHKEAALDSDFIVKLASYPELRILDRLWMVPPLLANAAVLNLAGGHVMICACTLPMLLCNLITLLFNVEYHPGHNPNPGAGGACKAVDIPRFLSELVGESYHDDHHDHPKKAHRPGLDLPYHLVLAPLLALGLIW